MVVFDDAVFRLLQIDPEQGVIDDIVLYNVEIAAHLYTRVDVVMRLPGIL